MSPLPRIHLSPPHMGAAERELLLDAFDSNWIAPLGPHVDAFEREMAAYVGVQHALATSSGTAALHLSLLVLGVEPGDEVIVSTLTFAATANAVSYCGARPVFIDSEAVSANLDPALLAQELTDCRRRGRLPRAVVVVDIYGQSADYARIAPVCAEFGVPVIEDAAEALGATCGAERAGAFGAMAALSFNGNKIITTSGGGMLLSNRKDLIDRARHLSTQARDPFPHYEHSSIGFNYRMSNLLAAVGRGQLRALDDRVKARRRNHAFYVESLGAVPGIRLLTEAPFGRATHWLTVLTIDPAEFGATREDVRLHLERNNIESRPAWKPMHAQPVFRECRHVGGSVADELFERGLCLPSGSSLTEADLQRVVQAFLSVPRATGTSKRMASSSSSTPHGLET